MLDTEDTFRLPESRISALFQQQGLDDWSDNEPLPTYRVAIMQGKRAARAPKAEVRYDEAVLSKRSKNLL